jgi:hypothetical protein
LAVVWEPHQNISVLGVHLLSYLRDILSFAAGRPVSAMKNDFAARCDDFGKCELDPPQWSTRSGYRCLYHVLYGIDMSTVAIR